MYINRFAFLYLSRNKHLSLSLPVLLKEEKMSMCQSLSILENSKAGHFNFAAFENLM